MTLLTWIGGGLAALLLVYLMYALLNPEKLS
jgi:K+-transporting ATPase KdpF subunit